MPRCCSAIDATPFSTGRLEPSAGLCRLVAGVVFGLGLSTPGRAQGTEPPAQPTTTSAAWGTYLRPFAVDSPWNSRPVNPVLGEATIPTSSYFPAVQEGAYSTGVFKAAPTDAPMTVLGPLGGKGVWDPDAEAHQPNITIPHWPADVIPATGSDGHADIVDEQLGIVHSFFVLKKVDGTWRAQQYAWTPIAGRGWGNPSHYFQGARAAAVPSMGGVIRKHELNDGLPAYSHALAMSLTFNALSPNPAYVYPATSADSGAATSNSGQIPEGALLMLPAGFDTRRISSPALRKIAETLKTYGGYVVDRNVGTPFVVYVEIGAGINLHGAKWNNVVANELDLIRRELRPLIRSEGWFDGDGRPVIANNFANTRFNLLSMRGPWRVTGGNREVTYDTWRQAAVCSGGGWSTTAAHAGTNSVSRVSWALPRAGLRYTMTASAPGGNEVKLDIVDLDLRRLVYSTGFLGNGESRSFEWPATRYSTTVTVSCESDGAVSATLLEAAGIRSPGSPP